MSRGELGFWRGLLDTRPMIGSPDLLLLHQFRFVLSLLGVEGCGVLMSQ